MKFAYKLLALPLFIASHSYAAVTIPVTTFQDENGENPDKCSLREAVTAVNTKKAFGGCRGGELYLDNIIKLESGTYVLSLGEIVVARDLTLNGALALDNKSKDSITGGNKRLRPLSIISGNGQRLFNTVASGADMGINAVTLTNGSADKGGAIIAGGGVVLSNVTARNNQASVAGGVFYLEGDKASISVNNSTFENNTAAAGAVLAMSCTHHLTSAAHTINFAFSSILNNGADNNNSIFENCGNTSFGLDTSTLAKNTAHTDGGIIHFNTNSDNKSALTITRSTLMENNIAPVLLYGNIRHIAITSSVLAFNNGKGCKQQSPSATTYSGSSNVFKDVFAGCPTFNDSKSTATNLDSVSTAALSNEFTPLGDYGGLTLTYLPKISSTYVLNKGAGCNQLPDQRGSETSHLASNTLCDIGSVERRVATTVIDQNAVFTNKAGSDRVLNLNILKNDIPSETDNTDDAPHARGNFKRDANGQYIVEIVEGQAFCSMTPATSTDVFPLLKFDTGGQVTPLENAKICKYRFLDTNDSYSNIGELRLRIDNMPPKAGNDTIILPAGSTGVVLPLLDNDDDKDDGKYGALCTADDTLCNGAYIQIITPPRSGVIEAEKSGLCPDTKSGNTTKCLGGKLTYRPNNTLAPFNDSFTYVVYDRDKTASEAATVTIANQADAAEADTGSIANAGGLGWLSLLALSSFAFYRRFRKSQIV